MNYPNHTPKPPAPCKACGTVFKPTVGQRVQKYCDVCHIRLRDPRRWAIELKRENIELRQLIAELTSQLETGADTSGKMNDERNVV